MGIGDLATKTGVSRVPHHRSAFGLMTTFRIGRDAFVQRSAMIPIRPGLVWRFYRGAHLQPDRRVG